MHRSFPDCLSLMQELRDQGYARVERGEQSKLQTKAAIRRNKLLDRVYCIRVPSAVWRSAPPATYPKPISRGRWNAK
jgi:hypothetical protein